MQEAVRMQRFDEGDCVEVIGPLAEHYKGRIGVVRSIHITYSIYRYSVEFENGTSDTFFAFELRRVAPKPN